MKRVMVFVVALVSGCLISPVIPIGGTTLAAAEARIAGLPPDQAAAAWLAVAEQYRAMSAVTWAEIAVTRSGATAGADHGIAAWVATTHARYGIPRNSGLPR